MVDYKIGLDDAPNQGWVPAARDFATIKRCYKSLAAAEATADKLSREANVRTRVRTVDKTMSSDVWSVSIDPATGRACRIDYTGGWCGIGGYGNSVPGAVRIMHLGAAPVGSADIKLDRSDAGNWFPTRIPVRLIEWAEQEYRRQS